MLAYRERYGCTECGHAFEKWVASSTNSETRCPHCSSKLVNLIPLSLSTLDCQEPDNDEYSGFFPPVGLCGG